MNNSNKQKTENTVNILQSVHKQLVKQHGEKITFKFAMFEYFKKRICGFYTRLSSINNPFSIRLLVYASNNGDKRRKNYVFIN